MTFGHFEVIESLPGMLKRKKTANVTTKMTKHFPFIPMAPSVPNNAPTNSYMTLSERQLYTKFGTYIRTQGPKLFHELDTVFSSSTFEVNVTLDIQLHALLVINLPLSFIG